MEVLGCLFVIVIGGEEEEISNNPGGGARPGGSRFSRWYLVLYHNKDDGGYGY